MGAGGDERSNDGPEAWSETNTQVEGVDEADIVKTDGTHIYVLNRSELIVLRSWPAADTAIEARFEIEGYPLEMFVAEGRAIVFSSTEDPSATEDACANDEAYRFGWYPCWGHAFTKATVVDLNEGAPQVSRELYFEGHYGTSRRHDEQVRAVLQTWGDRIHQFVPYVWNALYREGDRYPMDLEVIAERIREWRIEARAAIAETTIDDWMPARYERVGDVLTQLPPTCDNVFSTAPGLADQGMTQVAGFNLVDAASPVTQTAIFGYAWETYASHDAFVLVMEDWSAWYRAYLRGDRTYSDATLLHRFGYTEDGDLSYEGSGYVPGRIHDQFSLDEHEGVLRAATTQTTWRIWRETDRFWEWEPPETANYVLTLRTTDDQRLAIRGATEALAPGERVFSARFLGDTGYVVTFRQVDPLFAIDLSNPDEPTVLGELKIPGFSDYMHPLGENHLLTIGRDATEDGRVRGLALQIFDVTDPTEPSLTHRHLFTDRWGWSEANYEHKAFTFFNHSNLLAFPYTSWGDRWSDTRSSLEVFRVTPEDGFTEIASIDHTAMVHALCGQEPPRDQQWEGDAWWSWYSCSQYGVNVRRGVFIDDYVYSLSYGGVRVHQLTDADTVAPVTDVPF
jgi:hypothetical protein